MEPGRIRPTLARPREGRATAWVYSLGLELSQHAVPRPPSLSLPANASLIDATILVGETFRKGQVS